MTQPSNPPYGATRAEWEALYRQFPARLLPVVSNPNAQLSPNSAIKDAKAAAKTPTEYGPTGLVRGVSGWSTRITTPNDVRRWVQNPDYGICLKTGYKPHDGVALLAIDIDLTRTALIADILAQLDRHTDILAGIILPRRHRGASPRVLVPVAVTGTPERLEALHKRIFAAERDPDGKTHNVELLAHGNQFVCCGTHPSGERYRWEADHPALGMHPVQAPPVIPSLTVDDFEAIWGALVRTFSVGDVVRATPPGKTPTVKRATLTNGVADPITDHIHTHGWATSATNDGRINILCPFRAGHTDGEQGAESSTQYFPAGVGGFHNGHFKCLHAHCLDRSDRDFLDAIGYDDSHGQFVDETAPKIDEAGNAHPGVSEPHPLGQWPHLIKAEREMWNPADTAEDEQLQDKINALFSMIKVSKISRPHVFVTELKTVGKGDNQKTVEVIHPTPHNLDEALSDPDYIGYQIIYDTFLDEELISPVGQNNWQAIRLQHDTQLIKVLENRGMKKTSLRAIRDARITASRRNQIDSLKMWASSLKWDGVPRVRKLFEHIAGLSGPYYEAVAAYHFTAKAGRALNPGVKADMTMVLISEEGFNKSSLAEAMAPHPSLFTELSFASATQDRFRLMEASTDVEIPELSGLKRSDLQEVKAFLTLKGNKWAKKFVEKASSRKRRCVFTGTTNEKEFNTDENGGRRWLPVELVRKLELAWLKENNYQLWAEAVHMYLANGVMYEEAERLAKDVLPEYTVHDTIDLVYAYFDRVMGADGVVAVLSKTFTLEDVKTAVLTMPNAPRFSRLTSQQIGAAMRRLGFEKKNNGGRFWYLKYPDKFCEPNTPIPTEEDIQAYMRTCGDSVDEVFRNLIKH